MIECISILAPHNNATDILSFIYFILDVGLTTTDFDAISLECLLCICLGSCSLGLELIHMLNKYILYVCIGTYTYYYVQMALLTWKLEFQIHVSRRLNLKVMESATGDLLRNKMDAYQTASRDPLCPVLHIHESDVGTVLLVRGTGRMV